MSRLLASGNTSCVSGFHVKPISPYMLKREISSMVTGSVCGCCDCCGCSTITMASRVCVAVSSMEVRARFGVGVGTVDFSDVSIADNSRSYKLDQARNYCIDILTSFLATLSLE